MSTKTEVTTEAPDTGSGHGAEEGEAHHLVDDRLDRGGGPGDEARPFGHALVELARKRPEIIGMTADLGKYTDLHIFKEAFPTATTRWAWPSSC